MTNPARTRISGLCALLCAWCCLSCVEARARVVISELMAINDSALTDSLGRTSDWIELHNGTTNAVDLAGWYLTDDSGDLTKCRRLATNIVAGGYVVIFADGDGTRIANGAMYVDFKLSGDGEYLALVKPDGQTVAHEYAPEFPQQYADISYGISPGTSNMLTYFATPTPGAENSGDALGVVADTKFSVDRGFYSTNIAVAITTATAGATIHYTLDGSTPTETDGIAYAAPVAISNTTCLRAMAWKTGYRSTDVDTHTYIFPQGVLRQDGAGFPNTWGHAGADYDMDPDIVAAESNAVLQGLQALPVVSLRSWSGSRRSTLHLGGRRRGKSVTTLRRGSSGTGGGRSWAA